MNADLNPVDLNQDELHRLISAWCDEVIADVDFRRLQGILIADSQARLNFISYMGVHGGIKTEIVGQEHLEAFVPLPLEKTSSVRSELGRPKPQFLKFKRWQGVRIERIAWAAVLLIAVLGGTQAWYRLTASAPSPPGSAPNRQLLAQSHPETSRSAEFGHPEVDRSENNPSEVEHSTVLARVSEQSADCHWYFDRSGKVPTDLVRSGDTVRVTSGIMKLLFRNETLVTLHSPAIFEVVSEMRARVLLGKVTTKIGPNAKGFSIITPQATVIDLGTEFGIDVNPIGVTDVVVFKGAVDVDYPTTLEGAARQQRLHTGEAVHLDATGTASRIVAITNGQFSDKLVPESVRPPIITAVRDNIIQRDSAWNYYEIVHGGMAEDAKAFVDRDHEWNGVTTSGMPSYLLGGDYVKTFNNDKVRHDIEITVTVAHPCRLCILFDDRIPVPNWLQEGFRYTGDKIGVDEGPYFVDGKLRTEHQTDVGPGVSVDNIDSVWVRDILVPGSVHLGATETPISSINMYGIVAVPLGDVKQRSRDDHQIHN
jgi:hypothetical protein